MSKRRFARSGQTDRHAASLVDTHETRVSNHSRGENRCLPARGLASAFMCLPWPGYLKRERDSIVSTALKFRTSAS